MYAPPQTDRNYSKCDAGDGRRKIPDWFAAQDCRGLDIRVEGVERDVYERDPGVDNCARRFGREAQRPPAR